MAKKIDPLNKKLYSSVSTMLTVADVKAAVAFYQKAFGFEKRAIMDGPDGKAIHAELTLRGTTLMLSPKFRRWVPAARRHSGAHPRLCISDRERGQDSRESAEARGCSEGPGDGHVLG